MTRRSALKKSLVLAGAGAVVPATMAVAEAPMPVCVVPPMPTVVKRLWMLDIGTPNSPDFIYAMSDRHPSKLTEEQLMLAILHGEDAAMNARLESVTLERWSPSEPGPWTPIQPPA